MARSNTRARTSAPAARTGGFDRTNGSGFRMSGILAAVLNEGKTVDGVPMISIELKDVLSVDNKPINQKVAMAYGTENIDDLIPADARIGDELKFFGRIKGGILVCMGPWHDKSSYEDGSRNNGNRSRNNGNRGNRSRNNGRQQTRGRNRR